MGALTVDLQDGFDGDEVEIAVNGERRWQQDGVTTNVAVSLAASVPLEVPNGPADVRVSLPDRGLAASLLVDVAGDVQLAANVEDGRLRLERLAERPYYL